MYLKFLTFAHLLQEKAGEGKGGGAGGDDKDKNKVDDKAKDDRIANLESKVDKLLEALTKKSTSNVVADDEEEQDEEVEQDLASKAKKNRDSKDKSASDRKALEAALRFEMQAPEWLKKNEALLPKEIGELFKAAEKENYDSPVEKDSAIKAGIIQEFFSLEANAKLLTAGLKSKLEDFLKLTAKGKEEKARQVFEEVFEPAFEMLKQVKKAEHLRTGNVDQSDAEKNYRDRLIKQARAHHLGEKK